MEVMPDEEEVALDAIPLAVKSPSIVDWKIHKEGKKSYYQIIRADGSSKMYLVFSHMLKSFDREDLETLYKLVKAKYGSTRPVEDLDLVLYGDLKTMFEPHVEDNVWKNQSDYRVLDWKLYDSCGVHSLRKQNVHIHMLVEKRYPLTAPTITNISRINEVSGSILLMIMKLLMKKLEILKKNIKSMGGLLGLKDFLMILKLLLLSTKVTTAKRVSTVRREWIKTEERIRLIGDQDYLRDKGFVFKERPNEAIDVPVEDEKSPSSELRGSLRSGPVKGQDAAPAIRECTFAGFMKCNPTIFCGTEGAVKLQRWFEKTESVFRISECVEDKKAKFAAAILQGPSLTWWNSKIATIEEIQRSKHELWNLKVKEYNIVSYTQRFNKLALMYPRMVEPKSVKVDAYI
ncbi:hypothetical protein Tco_0006375 [Tanacetum coccineum]